MHTKTTFTLNLKEGDQVKVSKGDAVSVGDLLVQSVYQEIEHFDIPKLLKIKPQDAKKHLKVKDGQKVKVGDTIALKKGLVSKQIVKTPLAGKVRIKGEKDSEVEVEKVHDDGETYAWFDGHVDSVSKEKITFSITAKAIEAKEGKGFPVTGELRVILVDEPVYALHDEVCDCILAVPHAHAALVAKADALGAVGIIAQSIEQPPYELPFLLVDDIQSLTHYHKKSVMVMGDEKQLLILPKDAHKTKKSTKSKK